MTPQPEKTKEYKKGEVEIKLHYVGDKGITSFIKELENEVPEEKSIQEQAWNKQVAKSNKNYNKNKDWIIEFGKEVEQLTRDDLKKVLDDLRMSENLLEHPQLSSEFKNEGGKNIIKIWNMVVEELRRRLNL